MTDIDRREFIASMVAATACAVAPVNGAAAIMLPNRPSACVDRLLLLANNSRVSDLRMGWLPIIAAALEKMSAIDPDLEVRQIKQKLGGLRIYYRSEQLEQLRPAVEEAEISCSKTCEECGRTGNRFNQHGFIRTLCEEHHGVRSPEISVVAVLIPRSEGQSVQKDKANRQRTNERPVECDIRFIYIERHVAIDAASQRGVLITRDASATTANRIE